MNTKHLQNNGLAWESVAGWLLRQMKLLPSLGIVLTIVGMFVWKIFAEPEVKEVVKDSLSEFVDKLEETSKRSEENQVDLREVKWDVKQIRFMLEESLPKDDVQRARRKSELLRPDK